MDRETLGQSLAREPFALALSAGFFGFYAHTGFLLALKRTGIAPTRYSGASAGSLVAAVVASGTALEDFAKELERIERKDFWDPGVGLGLLKGDLFLARVRSLLRVQVFEETTAKVAISVFNVARLRTDVLDDGDLAFAVRASCSFPGLLQPARSGGSFLIDGGVLDRPALAGLSGEPRIVYHHLVSASPWLSPSKPAAQIPKRPGLLSLAICGLPRSGPHRLKEGVRAMGVAYDTTARALDGFAAPTAEVPLLLHT
jgi:NTE family protein